MPEDGKQEGQAQNDEWFRDLVHTSYKRVYQVAYAMMRNVHDAQDVAQETFLKAYRSQDALKDRAVTKRWLDTISRNTAIDTYRKRMQRQEVPNDSVVANTAARQPSVERRLELKLFREQLLAMKPAYRNVLLLVYECGLTYEQLARVQQTSVSAVKSNIHRAKAKLRLLVERMEASG